MKMKDGISPLGKQKMEKEGSHASDTSDQHRATP
jgi:hypothetical protein